MRAAGLVLSLLSLAACRAEPPRSAAAAPEAAPIVAPVAAPLDYVERCPASDCAARLPTLVVLHGLGDSPERFLPLYEGLQVPARILAIRAPLAWGEGSAWFTARARDGDSAAIARGIGEAVPRVLATVDRVCALRGCDGRFLVSGFSQGGMMSYALAVAAPARVRAAFPVAGFLVPELALPPAEGAPTILAWHGDADSVVPLAWDRAGVERLEAAGLRVSLVVEPGVGHAIPPPTRGALLTAIASALAE